MTAPAFFPPATKVVIGVLSALGVPATFGTRMSVKQLDRCPLVIVRKIAGSANHPRFLDNPVFQLTVWTKDSHGHADGDDAGERLAEQVRSALWLANRRQIVANGGSISYFDEQSSFAAMEADESTPHGVYRYDGTFALAIRPASEGTA